MQIGIDSFISTLGHASNAQAKPQKLMSNLLDRIVFADEMGLDVFGIGEHHRAEFLDSAPAVILAAAATCTETIRLTSAVTVLSAADPVRVFEEFATLDLISNGRAEIVAGRGSFTEAFPLFGLDLGDYDSLYSEKLELLLQLRRDTIVTWTGKHRASLLAQGVYPRPVQPEMPIWLGAGGSRNSFARAGALGLPLMIAVIGGETHRFRPLVDLYRETGERAGHSPERLKVGLHSFGYVSRTSESAANEFYPGYVDAVAAMSSERGWPTATRSSFEAQRGPLGAYVIGGPDEAIEKLWRHSQALGGISRFTFQMDVANLSHEQLLSSIEIIGAKIVPAMKG